MTNKPSKPRGALLPLRRPASQCRIASLVLAVLFIAQTGLAVAAGEPAAASPTDAQSTASSAKKTIPTTPDAAMAAMADAIAKDGTTVAVTVGGQSITNADVADAIRALPTNLVNLGFKTLYKQVLDQLISEKLAMLSAAKMGLDKDPNVRRRQKMASERALADAWINRVADAAVTEQALRARYDRDIAGRPGPMEVRVRAILVESEPEAINLIGKIAGGAAFDDLARQFSKDPSAARGGDLDYIAFDGLVPEAAAVAFVLAPGQTTAFPIHTDAGYFVLRVEGRRQRSTPTFDEVRERLVRILRREAGAEAVRSLTSNMKAGAPSSP